MESNIEYVIIQAGGLGSRMGKFTKNKPKCLIPFNGKTMLERTIETFHNKKIIIICDYKKDILYNYVLNILKRSDITFINADDKTTSSGLKKAYNLIEPDKGIIFVWSDIIFNTTPNIEFKSEVMVGITDDFECRYSILENKIQKIPSNKNGVFGLFAFKDKSILEKIDESVSFVGGNLKNYDDVEFCKFTNITEIGTIDKLNEISNDTAKCRFFNKITFFKEKVIKECVDKKYQNLIENEVLWYEKLKNIIDFIPKILNNNPLTLSRINGYHIFDKEINVKEKEQIVKSIIHRLNYLHSIDSIDSSIDDMDEIYFNKTFNRVYSVKDIIPMFERSEIKINGLICKNPFHEKYLNQFKNDIKDIYTNKYTIIHGDPTFSNIIVNDHTVFLIDPRGVFGNTKIFGDPNYDWAKLYYSVNGNYDSINSKKFNVNILEDSVEIEIESNGFEEFSQLVITESKMSNEKMNIQHSLIWLSLTGYVREDIDSILYSFYKGISIWNLNRK
jgi:GTP:adenosylcobinamide-phosphate guanylyltransferase/thiamine kinase-like enzyme